MLAAAAALPGRHLEVWEQCRAALAEQLMYDARGVLPVVTQQTDSVEEVPCQLPSLVALELAARVLSGCQQEVDGLAWRARAQGGRLEGEIGFPDPGIGVYLEQQAVLGGAAWAYVLARLLAAGLWRSLGFEQV
jgi:hypothetical protein